MDKLVLQAYKELMEEGYNFPKGNPLLKRTSDLNEVQKMINQSKATKELAGKTPWCWYSIFMELYSCSFFICKYRRSGLSSICVYRYDSSAHDWLFIAMMHLLSWWWVMITLQRGTPVAQQLCALGHLSSENHVTINVWKFYRLLTANEIPRRPRMQSDSKWLSKRFRQHKSTPFRPQVCPFFPSKTT